MVPSFPATMLLASRSMLVQCCYYYSSFACHVHFTSPFTLKNIFSIQFLTPTAFFIVRGTVKDNKQMYENSHWQCVACFAASVHHECVLRSCFTMPLSIIPTSNCSQKSGVRKLKLKAIKDAEGQQIFFFNLDFKFILEAGL